MPKRLLASLLSLLLGGTLALAATIQTTPGQFETDLGRLQGGDTLMLADGNYPGARLPSCTIPSGSQGAPTIVKAANARQAIFLAGGGTTIELGAGCRQEWIVIDGLVIDKQNQAAGEGIMFRPESYHIVIQNMEIKNFLRTGSCSPSQAFGTATEGDHDITIRGNYIHDIGTDDAQGEHSPCNYSYGIYLASPYYVLECNEWARISAFAIHGYPSPSNTIIRGNYFHETGPVLVNGNNNQVYNNVLKGVGAATGTFAAIYPFERAGLMSGGQGNVWANNTIIGSGGTCMQVGGAAINNICWQNRPDAIVGASPQTQNLVGIDPQFPAGGAIGSTRHLACGQGGGTPTPPTGCHDGWSNLEHFVNELAGDPPTCTTPPTMSLANPVPGPSFQAAPRQLRLLPQ